MPGLSQRKKQLIRTFHFEARRLLSDSERRALFHALKEFQRYRQVDKLVFELRELLHSPEKLDLLRHIRDLIPRAHVKEFDGYFRQSSRQAPSPTAQRRRQNGRHSPEIFIRPNPHERVFDSMPRGKVVVVTIQKVSQDRNLGFSVRGGAEHGLGVYVSEIEEGSLAESSGLELGDKLLEVNNISVEEVTSSGAVKVLTGSNKLKLVVERTGQLPEWRLSREKVTWYNSHTRLLMEGEYEDGGGSAFIRGLDSEFPERRLTLSMSDRHRELGFNIRGGMEYGIGIYISKVDKGSIAERHGVRVGDQILEVNGISFSGISHLNAVEVLRSDPHLILTLRDMGRYPAYKELYAEYSWNSQNTMSSTRTGQSKIKQTKLRDMCLDKGSQRNRGLHLRVPIQSAIYTSHEESTELPLQSEIYLPHVQRNDTAKSNSWTYGPIQIENWPGAIGSKGSNVTGSVNPAYLPGESESDTITLSSEDTDDSSGVHGEYDITMDDIIARGDDIAEASLDIGDHPEVSGSVELVDLKSQNMESLSDLEISDNSESDEDHAVLVLQPASHTSDTSSIRSDGDIPNHSNERMEQTQVRQVHYELAPLTNSMDIDSINSTQPSVASENVTTNCNVSTVDKNAATQESKRTTKTVTYMDSSISDISQPCDTDSEDGTGGVRVQDEGDTQGWGTEDGRPEMAVTDPYAVSVEDDEDMICVMQNFDDQIRDLEQRQSNLGFIEMSSLSPEDRPDSSQPDNFLDVPGRKEDSIISGKWKAIKEKLKGSLRLTKSDKHSYVKEIERKDNLDPRGEYYGSMKLHKNSINKQNMAVLKEESRKLLSSDEYSAAVRHVETYHSSRDLDRMIQAILPILDKPEKMLLLRDIRGVLYASDLSRFDQRVHIIELDAYEKLSTKLHLQLNHVNKGRKPKKHLLMTEIDESGHFYIKPVGQHEQEQRIKQHVVDVMSGKHPGTPLSTPSGMEPDYAPGDQVTTRIYKDRPTLGLCVSGGSNSKRQPEVRVDKVLEKGAAANSQLIQPGMTILAVDDRSLVGVSHMEAVSILKAAFNNQSKSTMEIKLQHN